MSIFLKKKVFAVCLFSVILLSGVFCGKKGPIYPPLIKIPQKIEDLEVYQRGHTIVLQWQNPTSYMNGDPIEGDIAIELWLLKVEKELAMQQRGNVGQVFASNAQLHETLSSKDFSEYRDPEKGDFEELTYVYEIPAEEFSQMVFVFGLRVKDHKNKDSGLSSLMPVIPRSVPLAPSELQTEMSENSILLEWKPPEENIDSSTPPNVVGYNVYRESEGEEFHRINTALVVETNFSDRDFVYNRTYRYYVRASATTSSPYTESDNSNVVEILTKDILVPLVPTGLVAIAGENFVSLSWDANKETDLAGYRVWRKSRPEEEFMALTELIAENVYNDSEVEKNKRYFYAITALDANGNESPRSEVISVVIGREGL
jgi:fibronectin type 3 domain-containing protein